MARPGYETTIAACSFPRQLKFDGIVQEVKEVAADMNHQQEIEWGSSISPKRMLEILLNVSTPSKRKLRLFSCACVVIANRKYWFNLAEEFYRPAEAGDLPEGVSPSSAIDQALAWCASYPEPPTTEEKASLIRDIFGNPWRPIKPVIRGTQTDSAVVEKDGELRRVWDDHWLTWNGGKIRHIAESMYESRDFTAMPILADALEEAGCDNQEILMHCRNKKKKITKHDECPICGTGCKLIEHWVQGNRKQSYSCPNRSGLFPPHSWVTPQEGKELWLPMLVPHVRGCWVIDLILGKE